MRPLPLGLLTLAALVAACGRTSTSSPKADAGAVPPRLEAGAPRATAPAAPGTIPAVLGVTRDGKRALLRLDDVHGHVTPSRYRWIEIATNAMESEWTLSDPPLAADVVKHAAALLDLDEPHDERFAVSPSAVVFNHGDWLDVADPKTGRGLARLASDPSYYPQISATGAFVVYQREQGSLDGVVGNYMPFVAPLPSGTPSRRLEVNDVRGEEMRISPDGAFLYVQSGTEHPEQGCLVRVTIAPPSPTKKLFCADPGQTFVGVRFSRSRAFAAVMTRRGSVGPVRATFLRLPEGTVIASLEESPAFEVAAIDDQGVGLASAMTVGLGARESALVDPTARTIDVFTPAVAVPTAFYGAAWLSGDRFVVGHDGGVQVVEIPALPKTARPWPP